MSPFFQIVIIFVLVISLASVLRAGVLSSGQKDYYQEHNSNIVTLQVNDNSGLDVDANGENVTLVSLFNAYFGTEYISSQSLFDDLAVKEIVSAWAVNENAKIVTSFKSAALEQTLGIIDSAGNDKELLTFSGGTSTGLGGEPILLDFTGQCNFGLAAGDNMFLESTANPDGLIHMIAFDVTALMQEKLPDQHIDSAYLFVWEDLPLDNWYADFDYQDLAYVMINVVPVTTPEPATLVLLGIGGLSTVIARRRQIISEQ